MKLHINKPNEEKAIEVFVSRLTSIFGKRLKRPRLFGSVVRKERHEESDIDILILIDDLNWREKRRVWDEATNINIEYDTLLSPLVMTPREMKFLRNRERRIALDIDREGVKI